MRLVTAVLCLRGGQRVWQHVAEPRLRCAAFSDAFLDAYLALEGDASWPASAPTGWRGRACICSTPSQGEHAAMLGLPLLPLLGFLRQHGVVTG